MLEILNTNFSEQLKKGIRVMLCSCPDWLNEKRSHIKLMQKSRKVVVGHVVAEPFLLLQHPNLPNRSN